MRCLVTGAAGFIGSHLCNELLAQGNEVWGIDNMSEGRHERIKHLFNNRRFKFAICSISEKQILFKAIQQCDIIYHLAAVVGVKHYVEDPVKVMEVNLVYTFDLLEFAWKLNKKVVFASTSEVYGKNNTIPFSETSARVYGPATANRWCYAISKSAAEHLCFGYAQQGLSMVIIRYFNVYGPHADGSAYGGVATRFIIQALTNNPLTVHGDGNQTRCFTYINDIVKGTIDAGSKPEAEGKIFNLGHYHEVSILELAQLILTLSGNKGNIIFQPYEEFYGSYFEDIPRRVPDLTAAERILGYYPRVSLEEGLKKTIAWYRHRLSR
ncbi:MAG: NAD-dependent epimerase/dehydratase family protein [Firmicutes bacterium]|nr:NAD-dependent epimerase/dehydratase family protein [Bacillota bacterium]